MRRIGVFLVAWLAGSATQAQPVSYAMDPQHTRVHWEVRHFGTSTHRGRFDRIEGSITLDRSARRGEVSISIDTASVSSGVGPLDGMLRGNNFLAASANPTAYFVATQMRFDGDKLAEVRGEFTLRGTSRPLVLRSTNFDCRLDEASQREVCGGDFEAELLRSDFGITFGLPLVGDKVRLLIAVEASRSP